MLSHVKTQAIGSLAAISSLIPGIPDVGAGFFFFGPAAGVACAACVADASVTNTPAQAASPTPVKNVRRSARGRFGSLSTGFKRSWDMIVLSFGRVDFNPRVSNRVDRNPPNG